MQYMLLVYDDPKAWPELPEEEMNAIYAEYRAVSEDKATKHGAQLQRVEDAKTVRVKNGETLVTDGPFAETKEILSGFYLVDAATAERALEIAAKIPTVSQMGGVIEVRPIVDR